MTLYIAYVRVSTQKQGATGLGLEAQRDMIQRFLRPGDVLLATLTEVESGTHNARPVLREALAECQFKGATLLVAKLDRLARTASFAKEIKASSVNLTICDTPQMQGAMGRFVFNMQAELAELEAGQVSERTKAGLAVRKAQVARGETWISKAGKVCNHLGGYQGGPPVDGKLGAAATAKRADDLASRYFPIIRRMRAQGASLEACADTLTAQGYITDRGGSWTAKQVSRILDRGARLGLKPEDYKLAAD